MFGNKFLPVFGVANIIDVEGVTVLTLVNGIDKPVVDHCVHR